MISLIFTLLVALVFSFFALQNTAPITLRVFGYTFTNVPLYVITIASILIGVGISSIVYLARSITDSLTIFGKNRRIRSREEEINKLHAKIDELETENSRFKAGKPAPFIQSSFSKPNVFQRIRGRLST
ncbi:MAG: lipopolysaccharide assembly protein LapA domain-containing protein [Candidatus Curtissbacteria bacterium]|nr:lipopolysaccharide assembly protein LapA domain-containing protein [Candidatus Curtissbacteria bacterium]